MKTLNLKYLTFKVGDYITHRKTGYTAQIRAFKGRVTTEVLILDTPENKQIWQGYALPCTIDMKYIAKTFKHSPLTLEL